MSGLSHTEHLHGTVYIVATDATSAKVQLGRYLKGSTSHYSVHNDAETARQEAKNYASPRDVFTATVDIRRGVATDQNED
ncbi:hypothetical protein F0L17_14525 [Streptomyces sp. TRM43335]|uniref:Uncharacterized protein n=1 Tax=Streptomyces taklimakanensis TaxID=2569853 RepID=A0A6G2BEG9_9ACTN|nr:hypothetical protein [Streptomyces taklimakanensis]MTE20302.1 hypothetical protein [Streptomyces taklimakanensis]